MSVRDAADVSKLLEIHQRHPLFGVKRLAAVSGWSEDKTRRLRNVANIVICPKRSKPSGSQQKLPRRPAPKNLLLNYAVFGSHGRFKLPQEVLKDLNVWVADFTYLKLGGRHYYLSAAADLASRKILSFDLCGRATASNIAKTLQAALNQYDSFDIFHTDQGPQYLSKEYRTILADAGIKHSCSEAGKPWQNGHIERLFKTLKDELGSLGKCRGFLDLFEHTASTIYYDNHHRYHSVLKMPPAAYWAQIKESRVEAIANEALVDQPQLELIPGSF